jgi:hypothetical protein
VEQLLIVKHNVLYLEMIAILWHSLQVHVHFTKEHVLKQQLLELIEFTQDIEHATGLHQLLSSPITIARTQLVIH